MELLNRKFGICDSIACYNSVLCTSHNRVFIVNSSGTYDDVILYYCKQCSRKFKKYSESGYNIESNEEEISKRISLELMVEDILTKFSVDEI